MSLFSMKPKWMSHNQDRAEKALSKINDEAELKRVAMSEGATERTRMQAVDRMKSIDLLREVSKIQPSRPPIDDIGMANWTVGIHAGIRADKLESQRELERLQEGHDFQELVEAVLTSRLSDVMEGASLILLEDYQNELLADKGAMRKLAVGSALFLATFCEEHLDAEEDLILIATVAEREYVKFDAIRRLPLVTVRRLIDEKKLDIDEVAIAVSLGSLETLLRAGYEIPSEALRRFDSRVLADLAREGVVSGDDLVRTAMYQRAELEILAQREGISFTDEQYACPHTWESRIASEPFTDQDGWWYSEGDSYTVCTRCGLIIPM